MSTVRSKFLAQPATANGNFARWSDTYNFVHVDADDVHSGYAIGSAGQVAQSIAAL